MKHSNYHWLAVAATILIAVGCDENHNNEESPTNPELKCQSEGSTIDTWKCDGNTLSKCVSGKWEISQTCAANTLCNAQTGSCIPNGVPQCTNDTWKCDGSMLSKCVSGNWEISQACTANTLCNAQTGSCIPNGEPQCTNDTWKCDENTLSKCVSEKWITSQACAANTLCNAEKGLCEPNESECRDTEHFFADQCEADDLTHCGTHTNDCTRNKGWKNGRCIAKFCFAEECETGYHLSSLFDSDNIERTSCTEDTHDACGSVNTKCDKEEICTQGECKDKCQPGEVICGGSCIDPMTSRNFCGADVSCSSYIPCSEFEDCIDGKCVLSSCQNAEESLCTSDDQTICVNIHGNHPNHCGECGTVCTDKGTAKTTGCNHGQCTYTCSDNMVNCGSDTDPTCLPEDQLKSDPLHCGKCDTKCAENAYCQDGQCIISSCTGNECLFDNACINQNDHCGTQCLNCNTSNLASAGICQQGTCIITSCIAGYHLTDKGACEKDSAEACPNGQSSGTVNCNTLEYTKEGICVESKCQATKCQDNAHIKDGKCIADSTEKCGAAETNCTTIAGWQSGQCVNGTCVAATCASGYCLNPVSELCTNEQNISTCGIDGGTCLSCNPKQVCAAGKCEAKQCEGNVCDQTKDSDETLVCNNDDTHCGSGCQDCNTFTNHATAGICKADGTCQVTACETGYHIYNNACEADSTTNCGEHDIKCNIANANNECINKTCTFTCNTDYHLYDDACEKDSITNCGEHDKKCNVENANNECINKTCTFTCNPNYHSHDNACEENNVINCGTLAVSGSDTCEKAGNGSKIVLRGDVLALDKTYKGGGVVIEGQKITYVGCNPDITNATVITCPDSVISPGLINAHDHLSYGNAKPNSWGYERFDHRMDWRKGVNGHIKHYGPTTQNNDVHELRMLMSGVTSIYGSASSAILNSLTRNLDRETIGDVDYSKYETFPLGDGTANTYRTSCTQYDYKTVESAVDMDKYHNYGPHIGEGINDAALLELKCLSGEGEGSIDIFTDKLAIIQGIAATPAIMALMASRGSSLIWSPRSNISLYGDTANVITYDTLGVTIALGSAWIYSGSANMLREFACVNTLNQLYYNNHFSDYDIWRMGTYNSAKALGFDSVIGQLKAGYYADIAMYQKSDGRSGHRAVTGAGNKDVLLVMVDGQIAFGNANIVPDKSNCGTDTIGGVSKKICPNGTSRSYEDIKSSAEYPLFFESTPANEPTCIPQRTREKDTQDTTRYDGNLSDSFSDPNDIDGDGIVNTQDNCPSVFNPIRPQDHFTGIYAQSDFDGDGIGDACDPYPLCAENDTSCPVFNHLDRDNDGIPNATDNCPDISNPDQADTDSDGLGNLCDACPDKANLSDGSCPVKTFYSIQEINTAINAACPDMSVNCSTNTKYKTSGRVTALYSNGFFIQTVGSTSPGSGLRIYAPGSQTVALNDDITVEGTASSYYGHNQLAPIAITKTGSGTPIPPITITGSNLHDYVGMLVQFSNITISEIVAQSKINIYLFGQIGGSNIHLGNYIWTITPEPFVETHYTNATGVLVYDRNNYQVSPRSAADLVQ